MTLKLVRVDDRLIHGQVVAIWLKALNAKRIVIVDDRTARDEFLRGDHPVGAPGVPVEVLDLEAERSESVTFRPEPIFVLVRSPLTPCTCGKRACPAPQSRRARRRAVRCRLRNISASPRNGSFGDWSRWAPGGAPDRGERPTGPSSRSTKEDGGVWEVRDMTLTASPEPKVAAPWHAVFGARCCGPTSPRRHRRRTCSGRARRPISSNSPWLIGIGGFFGLYRPSCGLIVGIIFSDR
jgi:hypothetical protein